MLNRDLWKRDEKGWIEYIYCVPWIILMITLLQKRFFIHHSFTVREKALIKDVRFLLKSFLVHHVFAALCWSIKVLCLTTTQAFALTISVHLLSTESPALFIKGCDNVSFFKMSFSIMERWFIFNENWTRFIMRLPRFDWALFNQKLPVRLHRLIKKVSSSTCQN